MEPLYCRQHWDKYKCPDYRGLISGVNLYYKAQFGTFVSVLNAGVSSFQGVLNRGVSLYKYQAGSLIRQLTTAQIYNGSSKTTLSRHICEHLVYRSIFMAFYNYLSIYGFYIFVLSSQPNTCISDGRYMIFY